MTQQTFPLPGTIPAQEPIAPPEEEKNILDLVSNVDVLRVADQNYALISCVVPDSGAQFALKIRGVYETIEEAEKAARQLSMVDPFFDIAIVEMWKWLSLPAPEDVTALPTNYTNDEFNTIMKRYFADMKDRQKKMKDRIELSKENAKENEHGPVQEGAVPTEIEFTKTQFTAKDQEGEASSSS